MEFVFRFYIPVAGSGNLAGGAFGTVVSRDSIPTAAPSLEDNSVLLAVCNSGLLDVIKQGIKARLLSSGDDSRVLSNTRDIVAAAGTLECWLVSAKGDRRQVETIPPKELDLYLVEFFSLLKRRDGRDYDPRAFVNFRSAMDYFLAHKNYPVSIRRSELFRNSQWVFKMRRKSLVQGHKHV